MARIENSPFIVGLGFVAGFIDVFGFMTFNGLLAAHVTGNVVFLAIDLARGHDLVFMKIAALPIFCAGVLMSAWFIGSLMERQRNPRVPALALQAALLAVMGHHSYRSPSLRGGALPYLSCPRLTPREYQVLDRLACGLSDREIARELMVSEATARTYTKRLLQTLGVNNRLQAVLKGMRCGMVQI